MKNYYLIRLDDASPYMDRHMWKRVEEILDTYDVKPLVGVIPANEDTSTMLAPKDDSFWLHVNHWIGKGWEIALHGYNHVYDSKDAGINPFWNRSEFAGHSLDVQKKKIRKGVEILRNHGINPRYFFAPSHTFDENTLIALKEESDIRSISDTIGRYPYKRDELLFVPQIFGHCVNIPLPGIYTFCFHPNTMKDADFQGLESFLFLHGKNVISFSDIDFTKTKNKNAIDSLLGYIFFTYRKIKGLR